MATEHRWTLIAVLGAALALDVWLTLVRAVLVRFSLRDLLALRREADRDIHPLVALLQQRSQLAWLVQAGLVWAHVALMGVVAWAVVGSQPAWGTALLGFGALLGAVVMVGEWGLDVWATRRRHRWALPFARWALWWLRWNRPLLAFARRLHLAPAGDLFTEDTLEALAQVASTDEGPLESEERHMLTSIIRFSHTLAREIMVPRIDMVALEVSVSVEEALDTFIRTGFSRLPVYRETVDHIVGLLYAKDLLRLWREGRAIDSLESLLRPAYFVPEAKKVDELLAEMQAQRIHMAIVVDEYGGVAGLVTLEDIVEEIVGEIQDEYDQGEAWLYRPVGPQEYLFQGRIDLDEFAAVMGVDLDTEAEEADTLGGLIYSRIGRVPAGGETIMVGDVELTVEKVEGQRIMLVRARRRTVEEDKDA